MAFSKEWDECYKKNSQMSLWPWSDLVSLISRHCKGLLADRSGSVLEIGCGAGANIPFILASGLNYYAKEGSASIVRSLRMRYPELSDSIEQVDFTDYRGGEIHKKYDLIFDRAAITHNDHDSILSTLDFIYQSLNTGGIFIGSDWFSDKHQDIKYGHLCDDESTYDNFSVGQFVGVGKVHFTNKNSLEKMFAKFNILHLEEKVITTYIPDEHVFAAWNIVVKK